MSLIIKIQINHDVIEVISAQRIEGGTNPDDINTYKVALMDYREDKDGEHLVLGTIKHRYGDSAEVLAKKTLDFVLEKRGINNVNNSN